MTTFAVAPSYEPIGQLLTADEYDALPANPQRELVDGVIQVMATPTPLHQDVKIALVNALRRLVPLETHSGRAHGGNAGEHFWPPGCGARRRTGSYRKPSRDQSRQIDREHRAPARRVRVCA